MGAKKLDLGVADVHKERPLEGAKKRALKPITTPQRKALPRSAFALPSKRAYPVHDEAHAKNAMARLEQNKASLSKTEYALAKRNILKAYKRFGIKHDGKTVGTTRASIRTAGLSIHVHHMSGREDGRYLKAVELDANVGDEPKPTWNQIAKIGQWAGHPSGPFQITRKEIGEIVRNFRATQNRKIPLDFEHASEAEPTEGTIPITGAPAQGWIIDLEDRGPDGLWGLIEWGEPARTYVKEKKYRFFSPAIRFRSRDRVSGTDVGARMTSGALTNNPFLDGMAELMAASDKEGEPQNVAMTYAYSPDEYMPRVRLALRMGETATARECMDRLCQVEELFGKAGMVAMTEGVDLGTYMYPMREMVNAPVAMCWDEVFETVRALIRAAIGEHNLEKHHDELEDDDEGPVSSMTMRDDDMATVNEETMVKLRDAEAKVVALSANESALTLKLRDAETQVVALKDELKTLREAEAKRKAVDEEKRVASAFATYKDKKGLRPEDQKHMLSMLRAAPESFDAMFPPVEAHNAYMLRNLSAGAAGEENGDKILCRDMTTGEYVLMPKPATVSPSVAPAKEPVIDSADDGIDADTAFALTAKFRKDGHDLASATLLAHKELKRRAAAKTNGHRAG